MKILGLVLMILGIAILLFIYTFMDVTVAVPGGGRVVNFHLISIRSSLENFGLFLGVIGTIFLVLGKRKPEEKDAPLVYDKTTGRLVAGQNTKKCRYCAEEVLIDAIKCKHCQSDLVVAPPP